MSKQELLLYRLLWAILVLCIATGFAIQGVRPTLSGLWALQTHPARLLNDFTVAAGEGAALVNASLVAMIGLVLARITRIRISGPVVATVFTMLGFGLFGKTPLNCVPIILGVYLSARLLRKNFNEYILIALFGTALGPLVTLIAVETGIAAPLNMMAAASAGVVAGMLLPGLGVTMLRFHQGFNLYNIGFTAGFLALFAAALVSAASGTYDAGNLWNPSPSAVLFLLIPALSLVFLSAALILGGRGAFRDFRSILRLPGRLPSDFMDMVSVAGGLVNMSVLGLASWLYVYAVGGQFNGPVLGGILTVIGFAAFGKHPRNSWPVLVGVVAAALLFGRSLSAPVPILAALFGTTLAPLAGEFGPLVGILAGFLHLAMVERTGSWHLGMNLYNNGFSGGLTATFMVAVMEWYRSNKAGRLGSSARAETLKGKDSK